MKNKVYLAGPIAGLTYEGAQDWRNWVARDLNSPETETVTPMRGKSFLKGEGTIGTGDYSDVIAKSKAVTRRDFNDTVTASCVFVNLLGAKKVSIGTVMEIAWAYQARVPTVLIMEKGNVHEHLMIEEACHYVVDTLEAGVRLVKLLLNEVPV
jgi:nucleoside 2-deoxyribosyltransferase